MCALICPKTEIKQSNSHLLEWYNLGKELMNMVQGKTMCCIFALVIIGGYLELSLLNLVPFYNFVSYVMIVVGFGGFFAIVFGKD